MAIVNLTGSALNVTTSEGGRLDLEPHPDPSQYFAKSPGSVIGHPMIDESESVCIRKPPAYRVKFPQDGSLYVVPLEDLDGIALALGELRIDIVSVDATAPHDFRVSEVYTGVEKAAAQYRTEQQVRERLSNALLDLVSGTKSVAYVERELASMAMVSSKSNLTASNTLNRFSNAILRELELAHAAATAANAGEEA